MTDRDLNDMLAQLIDHESERLVVYDDATGKPLKQGDTLKGHPTIGIGRNLAGKGLTREESRYLCRNDIDECVRDLVTFPWFLDLNVVRQRAFVDLRFNLGPGTFRQFKGMFAALNDRDYDAAADHLKASLWYRQVGRRGPRIVHMVRTGTDPTT